MTRGLLNTTDTNLLTMGNATLGLSGGQATGNSTTTITAFVNGPLARVFPSGTANPILLNDSTFNAYYLFPVGKTNTLGKIWMAPSCTGTSVIKASFDTTNAGTASSTITALAAGARWDVPTTSGTVTATALRVGVYTAGVGAITAFGPVPVSADTAAGVYSNNYGNVANFASNAVWSPASGVYKPAVSYANIALATCTTPAPGATIASNNGFCIIGSPVTLSLATSYADQSVTFQWQSSPDNSTWTSITAANGGTLATYNTKATLPLYYK